MANISEIQFELPPKQFSESFQSSCGENLIRTELLMGPKGTYQKPRTFILFSQFAVLFLILKSQKCNHGSSLSSCFHSSRCFSIPSPQSRITSSWTGRCDLVFKINLLLPQQKEAEFSGFCLIRFLLDEGAPPPPGGASISNICVVLQTRKVQDEKAQILDWNH